MIVVFAGPTVRTEQVVDVLPRARCRGPAECGDIYRAVCERAHSIGLVDGYFDHRLSVWHKEVLWAIRSGVRVYGAASMGALRAAELASFGMVGVGSIFDMYARGVLEDDDEVAVIHEAEARQYAPQSEALVNLRATLDAAVDAQAISMSVAASVLAKLKRQFYPLRTARALMALVCDELPSHEFDHFAAWFGRHGVVNQKQLDALAMLRRMKADERDEDRTAVAERPRFVFQHTDAWERLRSRISGHDGLRRSSGSQLHGEVRLASETNDPSRFDPSLTSWSNESHDPMQELMAREPILYASAIALATQRAMALLLAAANGATVSAADVQKESEMFRRERGLVTPDATRDWLGENGLDVAAFSEFVHDTVLTREYEKVAARLIEDQIPHALRLLRRSPLG